MFEIGSSLRAARMRQRLGLSQAEHDTRIRAKYLGALEDEGSLRNSARIDRDRLEVARPPRREAADKIRDRAEPVP
jgi:hypothetical protein